MKDAESPPPSVSEAALRLRDERAAVAGGLAYDAVLATTVPGAGPKAIPGTRRESLIDSWRAVAGCDAWQKPDATLVVICWAVAEQENSVYRHPFPHRMFAFDGPGHPRELSAQEMASKSRD